MNVKDEQTEIHRGAQREKQTGRQRWDGTWSYAEAEELADTGKSYFLRSRKRQKHERPKATGTSAAQLCF